MTITIHPKPAWSASADIRICHPELDPGRVSKHLNTTPVIAQEPGKSRVPHGSCNSAGYWCAEHKIEYPERPDALFLWSEQFVVERESQFRAMLENNYDINVYIGVHSNVLTVGFKIPPTPTLWRLGIPVGIEYFSP